MAKVIKYPLEIDRSVVNDSRDLNGKIKLSEEQIVEDPFSNRGRLCARDSCPLDLGGSTAFRIDKTTVSDYQQY